jgi:hypothetical protein
MRDEPKSINDWRDRVDRVPSPLALSGGQSWHPD